LTQQECFPSQRTREHRLKAVPATLPAQIGCLDRHLVSLIQPWTNSGRAEAIDSTDLRARGCVWYQKYREKGKLPHTSIDHEAHWTKSGWHGWVYGWKLHVVSVVAVLTAANVSDSKPAPELLREVPAEVHFVLGDRHYNTPDLHQLCQQDDRLLVTTKFGRYPTPMMAWRFDASSISCVPAPMRILMNTSKAFSMVIEKFPPKV